METLDGEYEEDEVGRLIFCFTQQPEETPFRSVLRREQFDIGRNDIQRAYGINELTISTHHLRFRCVVYEDDNDERVAPMVYVRVLSLNPVQIIRTSTVQEANENTIQQSDADILLNHGDILQLTPEISLLFTAPHAYSTDYKGLDATQTAEVKYFSDQFLVTNRKLGVGGQACVFVAVKQIVGRQVACKIVRLPHTLPNASTHLQQDVRLTTEELHAELERTKRRRFEKRAREFNILENLSHPNIITLEKVICGTYNIYIFQELITGGDLLSYIDQNGALSEAQSAVIIRQLLKAVEYLHSNGVVHRDIKPENVLMTSWREGCRVILTDFGQARTTGDAKAAKNKAVFRMQSEVGTHGYAAPEVLQAVKRGLQEKGYSKAIDIWSIGCVTALLLTSTPLFPHEDDEYGDTRPPSTVRIEHHWNLSIIDRGSQWLEIGRKAKSFIKNCLVLDESQRLTAKQALLHPWFTNRHYAAEMEAAYQRAIQDWKPRARSHKLIEFIDTTHVVPVASRSAHVERLVEEVKSRHFQNMPPPAPMMSAFAQSNGMANPERIRTPLPGIGEDTSSDGIEVPATPSITQLQSFFANSLPDPEFTQFPVTATNEPMRRFSIEDFAPPETQLTDLMSANSPIAFIDSPTQSQVVLDNLSLPSLPSDNSCGPVVSNTGSHVDSANLHMLGGIT